MKNTEKEKIFYIERIDSKLTYNFNLMGSPRFFCLYKKGTHNCPFCSKELKADYTVVPNKDYYTRVHGYICYDCKQVFIDKSMEQQVKNLLIDNERAWMFRYRGASLSDYSKQKRLERKRAERQKKKEKLDSVEESVVMICVSDGNQVADYIITNSQQSRDAEKFIFYYTDVVAREVLAAAYRPEKNKRFSLNGKDYIVNSVITRENAKSVVDRNILVTEFVIMNDGGFSSSLHRVYREAVDLLLYSPYTKRYECIKATYDKLEDICYSDISLYREFVEEFGNPKVDLFFCQKKSGEYSFLNDESRLKMYGYDVSMDSNYSDEYRQNLLAEAVDLEIFTVAYIVKMLDLNLKMHTRAKDIEACIKWSTDREFIKTYKVNPQRFLIANKTI